MTIVELEATLYGGFHDAVLYRYDVDLVKNEAHFHFDLCIGDPNAEDCASREARRSGILTLIDVDYIGVDAPDFRYDGSKPYIVDLCEPTKEHFEQALRTGRFAGRFFSYTTNSFLSFSARSARFTYSDEV